MLKRDFSPECDFFGDSTRWAVPPPLDQERFDRLRALSPTAAIAAWLEGDFGLGDTPAMISAMRKDPRISVSDAAIHGFMMNAMAKGWAVSSCLRWLVKAR